MINEYSLERDFEEIEASDRYGNSQPARIPNEGEPSATELRRIDTQFQLVIFQTETFSRASCFIHEKLLGEMLISIFGFGTERSFADNRDSI